MTIRPIISMTGEHHFNEVVFDGVFEPDAQVVGTIGDGWAQVTSELAYERSGPERLLSTFVLLDALAAELASRAGDADSARAVGRVVSRLWACRQMSLAVAGALAAGEAPEIAAAAGAAAAPVPLAETLAAGMLLARAGLAIPPGPLTVAVTGAAGRHCAGIVAAIAHQLHGAIGTTEEHRLRLTTTRLWSWREEDGPEAECFAELGRAALRGVARAGGLWPWLSGSP